MARSDRQRRIRRAGVDACPGVGGNRWRTIILVTAAVLIGSAVLDIGVPVSTAHPGSVPARMKESAGTLVVDGHDYDQPTGCLTVRKVPRRIQVTNNTDQPVRVYLLPGCKGGVTNVVEPGGSATPLGASVQV
ncbi:hypothetical protein AB0N05_31875 [Nocardia sp. NPDC051030]|uniref:hypothetical protein n=1 Tax=Nocardia sp. NPDC051030 TaxID=3155162 RepID=UPI00344052A3